MKDIMTESLAKGIVKRDLRIDELSDTKIDLELVSFTKGKAKLDKIHKRFLSYMSGDFRIISKRVLRYKNIVDMIFAVRKGHRVQIVMATFQDRELVVRNPTIISNHALVRLIQRGGYSELRHAISTEIIPQVDYMWMLRLVLSERATNFPVRTPNGLLFFVHEDDGNGGSIDVIKTWVHMSQLKGDQQVLDILSEHITLCEEYLAKPNAPEESRKLMQEYLAEVKEISIKTNQL